VRNIDKDAVFAHSCGVLQGRGKVFPMCPEIHRKNSNFVQTILRNYDRFWTVKTGSIPELDLHTTGVIYMIIFLETKEIYIGFTTWSCWRRFGKHLETARSLERHAKQPNKRTTAQFLLAQAGTRTGSVVTIPLEKVELHADMTDKEKALVAKPLERDWILRYKRWMRNVVNFDLYHNYYDQAAGPKTHPQFEPHCYYPSLDELLPSDIEELYQHNNLLDGGHLFDLPIQPQEQLLDQINVIHDASSFHVAHLRNRARELESILQNFGCGIRLLTELERNVPFRSVGELCEMVFLLQTQGGLFGSADETTAAISKFRTILHKRQKRKGRAARPIFSPTYTPTSALIPFAKIFRQWSLVRSRWPDYVGSYAPPMVSFSSGPPLGPRVCNNKVGHSAQAISDYNRIINQPANSCICCQRRLTQGVFCFGECGHIATTDFNVLVEIDKKYKPLADLLTKGYKYRPDEPTDDSDWKDLCDRLSKSFARDFQRKAIVFKPMTDAFHKIITACQSLIRQNHTFDNPIKALEFTEELKKLLREVQEHFVLCQVDKAPENLFLVCKRLVYLTQENHLANSVKKGHLERCEESAESLMSKQIAYMKKLRIYRPPHINTEDISKNRLPSLNVAVKIHKKDKDSGKPILNWRHITGGNKVTIGPLSDALTSIFRFLDPMLTDLWAEQLASVGILSDHTFIVKSATEVRDRLEVIERELRGRGAGKISLATRDVQKFYPNLQHPDLKEKLNWLFLMIWTLIRPRDMNVLAVRTRSSTCEWIHEIPPRRGPNVLYVTAEKELRNGRWTTTFRELLDNLLANAHITHAGQVFLLLLGIPQGFSCCVYLAVWYLFAYELMWVMRCIFHGHIEHLKRYLHTMRLNDDIFTINAPNFPAQEIYPSYLNVIEEQVSDYYIHFLDLGVRCRYRKGLFEGFGTEIYDKRQDPDIGALPIQKYPAADSLLAYNVKANTIRNAAIRAFRLCSTVKAFCLHLGWVLCDLLNRGYTFRFILRNFWRAFDIFGNQIQRWNHSLLSAAPAAAGAKAPRVTKKSLRKRVIAAARRHAAAFKVLEHLVTRFDNHKTEEEVAVQHAAIPHNELERISRSLLLAHGPDDTRDSGFEGMLPPLGYSFVSGGTLGSHLAVHFSVYAQCPVTVHLFLKSATLFRYYALKVMHTINWNTFRQFYLYFSLSSQTSSYFSMSAPPPPPSQPEYKPPHSQSSPEFSRRSRRTKRWTRRRTKCRNRERAKRRSHQHHLQ
jgi:hypothetical protein